MLASLHGWLCATSLALCAACSTDPSFVDGAGGSGAAGGAGAAGGSGGVGATGGCGPDTSSDPDNCGACGYGCLGGDCVEGKCQPVEILGDVGAFDGRYAGIAVDATHVYVGDRGSQMGAQNGGIFRISTADGTPEIVVDELKTTAWEIAIDADHVYWTCFEDSTARRVAKDGGPLQLVADMQPAPNSSRPWGVAVDASFSYWAASAGAWRRAPIDSTNMATDLHVGTDASGIAVDEDGVAFVTDEIGNVVRVDGSVPTVLANGQAFPGAVAVDANFVYWLNYDSGEVTRIEKKEPGTAKVLATGDIRPTGIALDDLHVYWTTWGDCVGTDCVARGTVNRVLKTGGDATLLAEGEYLATDVAVDAEAIYWTTFGPKVLKLKKPR